MPPAASRARRDEIVRLAERTGLASVLELSRRFGVTASTIRRDLARLHAEGKLTRTYGGAIARGSAPEASLRHRIGEDFEVKRRIARWARAQVRAGETVLLDAGSTVGALAHELRDAEHLTVVTASLTAVQALSGAEGVRVEFLGGALRPVSHSFVGPLAEVALQRRTFDRAFLGTDGIDADGGICEADQRQTRLKELAADRANTVYVLAHAAKLDRRPFHSWARLPPGWTLVTDAAAPRGFVEALRGTGVDVVLT
ncbi:DeoR/GlpR family DNA-binding transcription regulator [Saccharopolyspora thermophila]|uniref:DeoR/GlpR family DNA-binding transcription regulator n=1 Tax=Saccharopolyspora thermophila TaxID=89367 RepID=A0ABN1CXD3_9PSEU